MSAELDTSGLPLSRSWTLRLFVLALALRLGNAWFASAGSPFWLQVNVDDRVYHEWAELKGRLHVAWPVNRGASWGPASPRLGGEDRGAAQLTGTLPRALCRPLVVGLQGGGFKMTPRGPPGGGQRVTLGRRAQMGGR